MIKVKTRTSYYVATTIGDEQVELPVTFKPIDCYDPIVEQLPDGGYVVGYLVHDDDPPNPLEDCDAMGKIYSSHRHAGPDQHDGFREAVGLDRYWCRDPELKPNPYAVRLDCYQHGGTVWAVSGSARAYSFPDQQWDVGHGAGVWVPDDACLENIWYHVVQELLLQPGDQIGWQPYKPGKKTRVYLKRAGGRKRVYASFENMVHRHEHLQLGQIAEAMSAQCVKHAEQAVDEYNKYLAGECYGICIDVLDAELNIVKDDASWGYLGEKYAQESLREEVNSTVKSRGNINRTV